MPAGNDRITVQPSSPSRRAFLVFLVCGAVNTLFAWVVYLLFLFVFSYGTAYSFSYGIGIFSSYYLNATFVFKEKLRWSNALQYPLVFLIQYLFSFGLLYLMVEVIGLSKYLAPWVVVALTIPVTYQLSRYATTKRFRVGEKLTAAD